MARVALKSISFFAFIFVSAVLLATSVTAVASGRPWTTGGALAADKQVETVKPKASAEKEVFQPQALCSKPSGTYSGYCGSSSGCNNECIAKESLKSGACQWKRGLRECVCYYDC